MQGAEDMEKNSYQRSTAGNGDIKNRVRRTPERNGGNSPLNHEQECIRKWLKQVRFKKAVLGGVKEADVWKKIAELNTMYEAALSAERARYDALLEERGAAVGWQVQQQAMHAAGQQQTMQTAGQQMQQRTVYAAGLEKAGDGEYD